MNKALVAAALAAAVLIPAAPAEATAPTGYDEKYAASLLREGWRRTPTGERVDTCRLFQRQNAYVIRYYARLLSARTDADETWARSFVYRFFAGRCVRYGY